MWSRRAVEIRLKWGGVRVTCYPAFGNRGCISGRRRMTGLPISAACVLSQASSGASAKAMWRASVGVEGRGGRGDRGRGSELGFIRVPLALAGKKLNRAHSIWTGVCDRVRDVPTVETDSSCSLPVFSASDSESLLPLQVPSPARVASCN